MDGIEIEAFRADTRASKGLTAAHIAEAASLYDQDKAPAPLVFGHPASDSPALGVVAKARAEGAKLFVTLNNVADAVVQGVKERRILGRSIAFWDPHHPSNPNPGKFSIRHLGLLGGQAPAIPGMPALKFSADDSVLESDGGEGPADAIIFAVEEPATGVQTVTEPAPAPEGDQTVKTAEQLQQELDAANAARETAERERDDARSTFAAQETARREGENKAVIAKAVAAGSVLPAEVEDLQKIFNALPATAMTFAAGELEPRAALGAFLEKLPKRSPVAQPRLSPEGEFSADDSKAAAEVALTNANKGLAQAWKAPAIGAAN